MNKDITTRKIELYKESLFSHGIISLCYILSEYEKEEDYEECKILLEVIEGIKKKYDINIPSLYNEVSLKWSKSEMSKLIGKDVSDSFENMIPVYAGEIRDKIKKLPISE